MSDFHEELLREYPNQIHICEGRRCFGTKSTPDNTELEQAIATELGTTADEIYAKTIEIAGKKFRIECHGCLGWCARHPRVDIITEGPKEACAKVTSLESLKEQAQQVIDGTWDFPDLPPDPKK